MAAVKWDIRAYETVDSTNLEAKRLLDAGASAGLVVKARHQTGGRGRMGRAWLDLPGKSLMASFVLGGVSGFEASMLIAISARAAIVAEGGTGPLLKWPNDLVYGDRKVGGILSELYGAGGIRGGLFDERKKELVIIGLGLNVSYLAGELDMPAKLRPTSLLIEEGKIWNIGELFRGLLRELEARWRKGRGDWFEEYRENLAFLGRVVTVEGYAIAGDSGALETSAGSPGTAEDVFSSGRSAERSLEGILEGVDGTGNLLLGTGEATLKLVSGDIYMKADGD